MTGSQTVEECARANLAASILKPPCWLIHGLISKKTSYRDCLNVRIALGKGRYRRCAKPLKQALGLLVALDEQD
ncbi:hypothetical protein BBI10_00295 [Pseudomonas graminis]|jgi:hypothetical protein|uniref:Uncharacterized protein n=1 Tax=Pseudomonas graminis TaxID=158627 RepID=A0A1C2EG12_9PSED|nr:hypothetical protein BBI10_00295 [Pseudomonas graminis]